MPLAFMILYFKWEGGSVTGTIMQSSARFTYLSFNKLVYMVASANKTYLEKKMNEEKRTPEFGLKVRSHQNIKIMH